MAAVAKRASGHTHTCSGAHTRHTHRPHSLTIHSPHYHIACLSDRTGPGGYVLLFYPGAPSKCLGIAFTVMTNGTFPFPSNQKMPRDQRFKPELKIAGLMPKLAIVTKQCQSQGLCEQIHLGYKSPSFLSLFFFFSPQADNHSVQAISCQSGRGISKGKQHCMSKYISVCWSTVKPSNSSNFKVEDLLHQKLHHKSDCSDSKNLQFVGDGSIRSS